MLKDGNLQNIDSSVCQMTLLNIISTHWVVFKVCINPVFYAVYHHWMTQTSFHNPGENVIVRVFVFYSFYSFKCTPLKPRSTPIPTHTYLYIYPWGSGSVNNCVLVFYWLGVWKPGFGWFVSMKLIFEQPVWLIFI